MPHYWKHMKASEADRSSLEMPALAGTPHEDASPAQAQMKPVPAPGTAPIPRKPLATASGTDWPLPPPIGDTDSGKPAIARKPRREEISLSRKDLEALAELHERCKGFGVKIRKDKLLAAGLQLLAQAPTGKLLAILGPLESQSTVLRRKKKKPPVRG